MSELLLIVDHDDASRDELIRPLRGAGFRILEGRSGAEALRLARTPPDLIVLSFELPDIPALDIAADLRKDPQCSHIPLLLIASGSVTGEDELRAVEQCADALLGRPLDPSALLARVKSWLRASHLYSESAARRLLDHQEDTLREFLNAVPTTLWSAEPQGTIDFLNRFWFEFTGQDPAMDPRSGKWGEAVHPEDIARTVEEWRQALAEDRPIDQQFRVRRAEDGTWRWHRSRGIAIRDREGAIKRWAGFIADIHDQTELVVNLQEERDLRERFVATLSHDLRTPLTAARLNAQLLARKAGDENLTRRAATRIDASLMRADDMIRDILDASRLRAGEGLAIERTLMELRELVSVAIEDLSTVHGQRFVLQPGPRVEGWWSADAIRRIVENLGTNAVKYGAPDRPVTVTVEKNETEARIAVHNEGPAIPPSDLPLLFRPFSRTRGAETRRQRGWGLGLSLVKGLVEAHGGRIEVESTAEAGTTFTVHLPIGSGPE